MNSNPPGPLIQLVEAIGALLRSSRPRVGDLRTLVEQTRARCHAEDRSLSGLLNTHILIAGSPTSLLALAASVQDAGSALACIRLWVPCLARIVHRTEISDGAFTIYDTALPKRAPNWVMPCALRIFSPIALIL